MISFYSEQLKQAHTCQQACQLYKENELADHKAVLKRKKAVEERKEFIEKEREEKVSCLVFPYGYNLLTV